MPENSDILTEELLQELLNRPSVDSFISSNELEDCNLAEMLNKYVQEKSITKKEIIHKTTLNSTHVYQIFQGTRQASRNKVLQLAIAMNLNIKETNRLLHSAGVSSLYCKNRRDAIIIFAINKAFNLQKIDELLYEFNEDTISDT